LLFLSIEPCAQKETEELLPKFQEGKRLLIASENDSAEIIFSIRFLTPCLKLKGSIVGIQQK